MELTPTISLTGRRKIYSTVDDINETNIIEEVNSALSYHIQNKIEMDYLYWYRRGIQPILTREKERNKFILNKVIENHAEEIVDFKNGYFLTQPAFYIARNEEKTKKVKELNEYLYNSGKNQADNKVVDWFHTVGKGCIYVKPHHDEDIPFKVYSLDPRNAFVVYSMDAGNEPLYAVNTVVKNGKVVCDVFTKDNIYKLVGTELGKRTSNTANYSATVSSIDSVKRNEIGLIPIIEYCYNSVNMGAFEPVISLLDTINTIQSNRADGVEQFIQSLCVATNVELDEDTTADDIKKSGLLLLRSTDGNKADFQILSEQLDQSQTQVLVDYIYQQILTICGMPSTTKGGTSTADTGVAVLARDGWYQADNIARNTEDLFKESNRLFDEVVLKILQGKKGFDLKLSDFEIQFVRNETANVVAKAQAFNQLLASGLDPVLCASKSGISNDPQSDIELSKPYLEMIWGNPFEKKENTQNENEIQPTIENGKDKEQVNVENCKEVEKGVENELNAL